jgi:hypothetical protein
MPGSNLDRQIIQSYDCGMRIFAAVLGGVVLFLLMMATFFYVGGERPILVSVYDGPSFAMRGSGQLASFTVYAPKGTNRIAISDKEDSDIIWQIVATKGYFEGVHVNGLDLTYGKVPSGYTQLVPEASESAPPLSAGLVYSFWAETTNAPIAAGFFYMDTKGPIQTYIPDLCTTLENGRNVRVRCTFQGDRAYREPNNLEEVVRKYRITNTAEAERFRAQESCEPEPKKKQQ